MLRFLKQLFQDSPAVEADVTERRLSSIQERLQRVVSGSPEEARLLNRAGDLELAAGHRDRALAYYGRSIDAHMELRQFDAATAICRKVLRLLPDVVRARCTLAWVSLGKGLLEVAEEEVKGYVDAALKADQAALAAQQLRLMSQYVQDPGFRRVLADKLTELGDLDGARTVAEGREEGILPSQAGWDPVVFAALLTPSELKDARDKGLELKAEGKAGEEDDFFLYRPDA